MCVITTLALHYIPILSRSSRPSPWTRQTWQLSSSSPHSTQSLTISLNSSRSMGLTLLISASQIDTSQPEVTTHKGPRCPSQASFPSSFDTQFWLNRISRICQSHSYTTFVPPYYNLKRFVCWTEKASSIWNDNMMIRILFSALNQATSKSVIGRFYAQRIFYKGRLFNPLCWKHSEWPRDMYKSIV